MGLDDHIRYLESRLAGCVPESLHQAQIAAYRGAIACARAAAGDAEYLAATGNLLELTRAEWIDRYQTAARLYDSMGDGVRAEIASGCAAAAAGAGDHAALVRAIVGSKLASRRRREGAEDAAAQIPVLVLTLVAVRLETDDGARAERRAELAAIWREIAAGDPQLSPERLLAHPPYRSRLPLADAGVRALIAWLSDEELEAAPAAPEPEVAIPDVDEVEIAEAPSAAEIAAPYRAAAAALDPGDPHLASLRQAYGRVDELAAGAADGNALLAAMAAEDLFVTIARAPLIAGARSRRDAIDPGQPALRAHCDRLIDALSGARSVAELELVELAAAEHLAVESAWSNLLFSIGLMPVAAALAYDTERSGWRRDRLRRCEELVVELFGAGTAALLEVDAVWELFVREVFGRGQAVSLEAPVERLVHLGETAVTVAGHVQAATLQWAIAEASRADDPEAALRRALQVRRFATPEAMRDRVLEVLDEVGAGGGALWPFQMWGEAIAPAALGAALLCPPRPALPL